MPTDWNHLLFGGPSATTHAAPPGRAAITRLIEQEARRQGVDPGIAVAIARQESGLDPTAVGDRGKSLGLFQLQRAAAIDAGIDPARRGDLHHNIRGGVTYFKQKLEQSGGNVLQALSRYNRGTPTYRGIGDPHYVEHVMRYVPGGARGLGTTAPAAPAPRDWGSVLGLEPEPVPASRDWGRELGLEAGDRAGAEASTAGGSAAPAVAVDWSAVLGFRAG